MRTNKYGYKVCYKQQGCKRLKVYLVTDTYDAAEWHVRRYENHSPPDRKTQQPLNDVEWLIIPIKTNAEYKRLWRGCPF